MGNDKARSKILQRLQKLNEEVEAVPVSTDSRPEAIQPGPAFLSPSIPDRPTPAEPAVAKAPSEPDPKPAQAEAKTPEPAVKEVKIDDAKPPEKIEPPPLAPDPPPVGMPVFHPVSPTKVTIPPAPVMPSSNAKVEAPRPAAAVSDRPPTTPPPPPPPSPAKAEVASFEKWLWPWLSRVGVALIFFGAVFFLKMVYDNLGSVGRVACGVGLGLAFLVGGEVSQRRKESPPAIALVSGGLMLLYLTLYMGFAEFKIIPQVPAFLLLALVTTTGVVLSLRHNSQLMMVLALAGGFLTPLMVSTGKDNQVGLMTYIVLLDLAVIGISAWRRWPIMTWLCYAATVVLFGAWYEQFYNHDKLGVTFTYATIFFAIFSVGSILNRLVQKREVGPERLAAVGFTAALYFGTMYLLMEDAHVDRLYGLFALAVSAFFFIKSRITAAVSPGDLILRRFLTGLAVFFITLAVPLQLDFETVTVCWAAEALALTAYGLTTRDKAFQYGGVVVLLLVFGHLFFQDQPEYHHYLVTGQGAKLVSLVTLGYGSALAAFGGFIWLHQRKPREFRLTPQFFIGAWIFELLFLLFAALLVNYYSFHVGYYPDWYSSAKKGEILNISLILTIFSFAVITVGIIRDQAWLRFLGLPVLGFALLKVVFYDLAGLTLPYRVISFVALGGLLIALSFVYSRYRERIAAWVGGHGVNR